MLWIQQVTVCCCSVRAVDSAGIHCLVGNFAVILHYLLINNLVNEDRLSFIDRLPKNLGGHTIIP